MDSIGIGISIFFVVYLIYWLIKNDGASSIGAQTGLLKMKADDEEAAKMGGAQGGAAPVRGGASIAGKFGRPPAEASPTPGRQDKSVTASLRRNRPTDHPPS